MELVKSLKQFKLLKYVFLALIGSILLAISAKIKGVTGGAIELKLVTHSILQNALLFTDVKNIKPIPDPDTEEKKVEPYSVPMFANHPNGSICRDFKFSAKIPDNVKNLSYVLNTSDEISDSDIAPFRKKDPGEKFNLNKIGIYRFNKLKINNKNLPLNEMLRLYGFSDEYIKLHQDDCIKAVKRSLKYSKVTKNIDKKFKMNFYNLLIK